ncbi:LCP family protein [Pedobacter psychrodurus]|nr:LCP family protein [Pedobacter psychrodurus]
MKIKNRFLMILLLMMVANTLYAQQILLIGSDSREENQRGNADLIMVITVKNKEVKLTSILRDTYVYIKGYGNQKLNAAYRLGGRKLLISTINANFKTKLVSSIVTDFNNTARVIDAFGGITINIDKGIHQYVNRYIAEQSYLKGVPLLPLTRSGILKLTGNQALAYARVRVAGTCYGDHARVERQKNITKAVISYAVKNKSLALKNISDLWPMIDTDINLKDYFKAFSTFLNKQRLPRSQVFPSGNLYANKRINGVGLVLKIKDFKKASFCLNDMIK